MTEAGNTGLTSPSHSVYQASSSTSISTNDIFSNATVPPSETQSPTQPTKNTGAQSCISKFAQTKNKSRRSTINESDPRVKGCLPGVGPEDHRCKVKDEKGVGADPPSVPEGWSPPTAATSVGYGSPPVPEGWSPSSASSASAASTSVGFGSPPVPEGWSPSGAAKLQSSAWLCFKVGVGVIVAVLTGSLLQS